MFTKKNGAKLHDDDRCPCLSGKKFKNCHKQSAPDVALPAKSDAEEDAVGSTAAAEAETPRHAGRPGPNQRCHCGSGKKYKFCCRAADDATNFDWFHDFAAPNECMRNLRETLQMQFPTHVFLDLTDVMLSDGTYIAYQRHHIAQPVVMLCWRTVANKAVYRSHSPPEQFHFGTHNILVMTGGHFMCVPSAELGAHIDNIANKIMQVTAAQDAERVRHNIERIVHPSIERAVAEQAARDVADAAEPADDGSRSESGDDEAPDAVELAVDEYSNID